VPAEKSDIEAMIQQHIRIEKFCRDTTATDETIEELLLYNKQLLQNIINFASSTKPGVTLILPPKEEIIHTNWHDKTMPIISYLKQKQNGRAKYKSRIAAPV